MSLQRKINRACARNKPRGSRKGTWDRRVIEAPVDAGAPMRGARHFHATKGWRGGSYA